MGAHGARGRVDALRIGDDAGDLASQIEPGRLAVAQAMRHVADRVEPHPVAERVIERVARHLQRGVERQGAVAAGLVAPPAVVSHRVAAVAEQRRGRCDLSLLQAGERGDHLEGRPGVVVLVHHPVQHRLERVLVQFQQLGAGDAAGHLVGIERGPRDHGEDEPGLRLHGHHRAGAAGEGGVGRFLQPLVQREHQVVAGDGGDEALALRDEQLVHLLAQVLAAGVHRDVLAPVLAAQLPLPAALEPAAPDRLAAPELVGLVVELVGRDLAHVADHVPEAAADPVVAVRSGDEVHAGELAAVRLQHVDLVARDVQLDQVRLELLQLVLRGPRALVVLLHALDVLGGHLQIGGELGHHLVALLALAERGGEEDVERGAVVDQDAPLAILDHAAVGGDEERLAEVAHRLRAVLVAAQDLQLVETHGQDQHGADHHQRAQRGARAQLPDLVGVAADQPQHRRHQRTRVAASAGTRALSRRRSTEKTAGAAMAVPSALQNSGTNCSTRPSLPGATK